MNKIIAVVGIVIAVVVTFSVIKNSIVPVFTLPTSIGSSVIAPVANSSSDDQKTLSSAPHAKQTWSIDGNTTATSQVDNSSISDQLTQNIPHTPQVWSLDKGNSQSDSSATSTASSGNYIYTDIAAGYKVTYPNSWHTLAPPTNEIFIIENNDGLTMNQDGSLGSSGDSLIGILTYNSSYRTIENMIKDPALKLSQAEINDRLGNIVSMDVGGSQASVLVTRTDNSITYVLVHNGVIYSIGLLSGSQGQYAVDNAVFLNFLSSLTFLN